MKYNDATSKIEQVPFKLALSSGKYLTKKGTKSGLGTILMAAITKKTTMERSMLKMKNRLSFIYVPDIFLA
jgi:hypothetical protein